MAVRRKSSSFGRKLIDGLSVKVMQTVGVRSFASKDSLRPDSVMATAVGFALVLMSAKRQRFGLVVMLPFGSRWWQRIALFSEQP